MLATAFPLVCLLCLVKSMQPLKGVCEPIAFFGSLNPKSYNPKLNYLLWLLPAGYPGAACPPAAGSVVLLHPVT